MKGIVFGLGNPGKEYEQTRHNLGASVVLGWNMQASDEIKACLKVLLPSTFMNESGSTLKNALKFADIEPQNILVVHDDIELSLGEVELVLGGSARGHNGVRSIYDVLNTQDIYRLRLGIGRPPEGVVVREFVLGKFTVDEKMKLGGMQEKGNKLIDSFVNSNIKS